MPSKPIQYWSNRGQIVSLTVAFYSVLDSMTLCTNVQRPKFLFSVKPSKIRLYNGAENLANFSSCVIKLSDKSEIWCFKFIIVLENDILWYWTHITIFRRDPKDQSTWDGNWKFTFVVFSRMKVTAGKEVSLSNATVMFFHILYVRMYCMAHILKNLMLIFSVFYQMCVVTYV